MRKIFVDTFYVVALINQRDDFHEKAHELVLEFDSQPLLTTDAVLLSRKFSGSQQQAKIH